MADVTFNVFNACLTGETIVEMAGGQLDGTPVIVLEFRGLIHPDRYAPLLAFTHLDAVVLRNQLNLLIGELDKIRAHQVAQQIGVHDG